VEKSGDLIANPTELITLANTKASAIPILNETYNAIAAGYIYLDDGSSSVDIARIDFYAHVDTDNTICIHFKTVTAPIDPSKMGKATQVSAITFLWASSTGLDKLAGKPASVD